MIEAGLRTWLLSKGALTSRVEGRIRVKKLRQTDTFPAIVIDIPESSHHNDIQADGGLVESTVSFMCIDRTMQGARELCEELRQQIAGYTGMAGLTQLQGVFVDDTTSGIIPAGDESDNDFYSCDLNCTIWHAETVPST